MILDIDIEPYITSLKEAAKNTSVFLVKLIDDNIESIRHLVRLQYIRNNIFQRIKSLDINAFAEQAIVSDYKKLEVQITEFIKPILVVMKELKNKQEIVLPEALKSFLIDNGITSESNNTIQSEIINIIKEQFMTFKEQASDSENPQMDIVYNSIKIMMLNYLIEFAKEDMENREIYRNIGLDCNIFTDDILMKLGEGRDTSVIYPLIDIENFLDNFEKDEIDNKRKKYIKKEDYINRMIKHIRSNNIELIKKYYDEIIYQNEIDELTNLLGHNVLTKEDIMTLIKLGFISKQSILILYSKGLVIDNEEELTSLMQDDFETELEIATADKKIEAKDITRFSTIDSEFLLRLYDKKLIDLSYVIDIYLLHNHILDIDDIELIIEVSEETGMKQDGLTNLSGYILQRIMTNFVPNKEEGQKVEQEKEPINLDPQKIKELYLKNYLIFDDLIRLIEAGIITNEEAKAINDEIVTADKIDELKQVETNGQETRKSRKKHGQREFEEGRLTKSQERQVEQLELIIEELRELGFIPKIDILDSGEEVLPEIGLGDYKLFLSQDNPEAVILVPCRRIPETNKYYKTEENKTLVVSLSTIYNYLLGKFGISADELLQSKYLLETKIGKNWRTNIVRKLKQINEMITGFTLEQQEKQQALVIDIENNVRNKGKNKIEEEQENA